MSRSRIFLVLWETIFEKEDIFHLKSFSSAMIHDKNWIPLLALPSTLRDGTLVMAVLAYAIQKTQRTR